MINNKTTMKMVTDKIAILQRSDEDMVCPIVPPIEIRQRVQNALGQVSEQVSIQKSPCNTNCPLFSVISKEKIILNCGCQPVEYIIEKWLTLEENKGNNLKII